MSFLRFLKGETWLLVFVGGLEENKDIVISYLSKVSEVLKISIPKYHVQTISQNKSHKIPSVPSADNEISENFSEFILNDVIEWKNTYQATQVAIMLPRTAFSSDEVFVQVVNDSIFKESNYHAICSRGNFLDTEKRKKCVKKTDCTQCSELASGCTHSCLIRLIWLIFQGKNDKILETFDSRSFD